MDEKQNDILKYALLEKDKLLEYIAFSSSEIISFGADLSAFLLTVQESPGSTEMCQKYFNMIERLVNKMEELGM